MSSVLIVRRDASAELHYHGFKLDTWEFRIECASWQGCSGRRALGASCRGVQASEGQGWQGLYHAGSNQLSAENPWDTEEMPQPQPCLHWTRSGRCSALVRLADGDTDLYMGLGPGVPKHD